MKYWKQKSTSRKYVKWLYELFNEGKFHELPMAKKIKNLPSLDSTKYIDYGVLDHQHQIGYFDRIYHCADTMHGFINPKTNKHIVTDGIFCEHRFCPICATKRSLKEFSKITFQMEELGDQYEYFFLTLTLPNNKDGFREELNLIDKSLRDFLRYFRYHDDRDTACSGAYGSYEITKSDKGWHPHLHLILPFKKSDIVRYEVKEFFNGRRLNKYVQDLTIREWSEAKQKYVYYTYSHDSIRDRWLETIKKHSKKYNDYTYFSIGFERCYNIDKGKNELTKYLIDFADITSKEDLYIYLRDSYGIRQRVRRGCFVWTDEFDSKYKKRCDEYRSEMLKDFGTVQNGNFIHSRETVQCSFKWNDFGLHYTVYFKLKKKKPILWTDRYEIVDVVYSHNLN